MLDPSVRDRRLDELLRRYHASRRNRILVFVLYKKEASRVEAMLAKRGWKVRARHPQTVFAMMQMLQSAQYVHSLGWVCSRLYRFLPAALLGGMHGNGDPLCLL